MMDFIHGVMKFPGAIQAVGNVLINRIINQTARGFGDEIENKARVSVYKVLLAANPGEVCTPGEMFVTMTNKPQNNKLGFLENMKASDEVKQKLFGDMEQAQAEPILNSAEKLVELLEGEPADLDSWDDIDPIGQYSVAVRAENGLRNSATRYQGWINENEAKAKKQEDAGLAPTATHSPSHKRNVQRLAAVQEALKPDHYPKLVDAMEKAYAKEIAKAKDDGVNLPERLLAAA